ncbi:MAG TPA: protein translocase subunit SecF, partial [Limnochordales bacterium]
FGVSAVVALVHDVLVVLALFALARLEVTVSSVAAVLTVLGYSVNDTIVVFDRIREKLRRAGRTVDYAALADEAIVETLPRTLNTAGTTLVVVVALLALGGANLRPFLLALLVGIVSGTYSSIFVASALWVTWRMRDARRSSPSGRPATG